MTNIDPAADYEPHPASEIFPRIYGENLAALAKDIKEHGLLVPIVLHEGKILDGRNRFAACKAVDVDPVFTAWDGTGSPTAWVVSINLHRRHLDESQRGMVGARALEVFKVEARERMSVGRPKEGTANLPDLNKGEARDHAAKTVNVSPRTVALGARVLRDGTPALIDAVERGDVAISAAAEIVSLPPAAQNKVIAAGSAITRDTARELRMKKKAEQRVRDAALQPSPPAEWSPLPRHLHHPRATAIVDALTDVGGKGDVWIRGDESVIYVGPRAVEFGRHLKTLGAVPQ